MFKFRNDTRFIEYPQAYAGQYSIKIEQKVEDKSEEQVIKKWLAIGYISKSFCKEENKYIYTATDSLGNQIYANLKDLHILKKEFRNNGKQLAEIAQMTRLAKINQLKKTEQKATPQRNSDIKKLRENKEEKLRKQEVLKQEQKAKYTKIENEMDAKNTQKNKDNKQDKSEKLSDEHNQENTKSDSKNVTPENQEADTTTNRMDELNEIREQNNDKEQDLEMDR
jgi:hypothetical protein